MTATVPELPANMTIIDKNQRPFSGRLSFRANGLHKTIEENKLHVAALNFSEPRNSIKHSGRSGTD
jgi:hypothetical protein